MTILARRAHIVATAPFWIIGCTIVGAWRHGIDACEDVLGAWHDAGRRALEATRTGQDGGGRG